MKNRQFTSLLMAFGLIIGLSFSFVPVRTKTKDLKLTYLAVRNVEITDKLAGGSDEYKLEIGIQWVRIYASYGGRFTTDSGYEDEIDDIETDWWHVSFWWIDGNRLFTYQYTDTFSYTYTTLDYTYCLYIYAILYRDGSGSEIEKFKVSSSISYGFWQDSPSLTYSSYGGDIEFEYKLLEYNP